MFNKEKPQPSLTRESLVDKLKNTDKKVWLLIPVILLGLILLGAKVYDSNSPKEKTVKKQPQVTQTAEIKPQQPTAVAPIAPATNAPPQATPNVTADTVTPATGTQLNGSSQPILGAQQPAVAPQPGDSKKTPETEAETLKKNVEQLLAENQTLKQQLLAQEKVIVSTLKPHYQNKPIRRKPSTAFAEVGDRRWDENSSYLVK